MGVFAEFERSMIVERMRAGVARAKAAGKHCGRPAPWRLSRPSAYVRHWLSLDIASFLLSQGWAELADDVTE
jgi:DNA invertase Pin-like site-specific DNA recombinase